MKENTVTFTESELDILNELINISFGLSASIIGDMINCYAHLHVPNVEVVNIKKLDEILFQYQENQRNLYFTKQRVMGDFEGEILFSLEANAAQTFTELLMDSKDIKLEDIHGAILELTNIITSACMGKFAEITNGEIVFSSPTVEESPKDNLLHEDKHDFYTHVLLITTNLDIEEKNIWGQMYIMINDSMIKNLRETLKTFL